MKPMLMFACALFACAALLAACDDEEDNGLDSSHPGWGDPGCFGSGCHDQETTHHSDLRPYECVECHGTNGSPAGHGGETPCGDCHGTPHGNNGFPDPESCLTCH
jgi:hypothetical protein